MKMVILKASAKNVIAGLLAATIVCSFGSCSNKVAFLTSSAVPAARGSVKVKKDDNKNYHIQVSLENLAEVKRLQPPRQSYVVWMEADQQAVKNIGQINSSSSMLSSKLKASFSTVSTVKPSKIFITAEDDVSAVYPGTQLIISTDVF